MKYVDRVNVLPNDWNRHIVDEIWANITEAAEAEGITSFCIEIADKLTIDPEPHLHICRATAGFNLMFTKISVDDAETLMEYDVYLRNGSTHGKMICRFFSEHHIGINQSLASALCKQYEYAADYVRVGRGYQWDGRVTRPILPADSPQYVLLPDRTAGTITPADWWYAI